MKTHFTLKSGRVLLLEEPFTEDEEAMGRSSEGMAVLEMMATQMERMAKHSISGDDHLGKAMLKVHGVKID